MIRTMTDHDYPENEGQPINTPEDDQSAEEHQKDENARQAANKAAQEAARAALNDAAGDPPMAEGSDPAGAGADGGAEAAKLKDQLLRLAAELENTRRRGEREKRDAGQYAIASFARDLIGVADNFERALSAAGITGDDVPEGHSDAFNSLVAGIQLTEKELQTILQRHGVTKLEPAGERFDPNLHQAVAQVPSADIPKGHVVDIAQPGYSIGERVLRAAMVTVSAGGAAGNAPGGQVDEEA